MSHRDHCPDDYESRSQARRDAQRDHDFHSGRHYRHPFECDEANDSYRREYGYQMDRLEEERQQERAAQRRREEQRQEEEHYMQQAYEAEQHRYEQSQAEEEAAAQANEMIGS